MKRRSSVKRTSPSTLVAWKKSASSAKSEYAVVLHRASAEVGIAAADQFLVLVDITDVKLAQFCRQFPFLP